jgi:hypothetical protein
VLGKKSLKIQLDPNEDGDIILEPPPGKKTILNCKKLVSMGYGYRR